MRASRIRSTVAVLAVSIGGLTVTAVALADTDAPAASTTPVTTVVTETTAAPVSAAAPGAAAAPDTAVEPFTLETRALTGPAGTDLTIWVAAVDPADQVASLLKVQVKTHKANGKLDDVRNLKDVAAPGGTAEIHLGDIARGLRVEVQVLIEQPAPLDPVVLRDETIVRLRPDLVVTVEAPAQTMMTAPVDIVAQVTERNGDVGAEAKVELWAGTTKLQEATVTVPADDLASHRFEDVALTAPVLTELTMIVKDADPGETDLLNNAHVFTVSVMEHAVNTGELLVASLGGFGVQMNQHLYAAITAAPPASLPDLEQKVKELEPQIVRIFYHGGQETPNAGNLASFYKTVELAQAAGAVINVTYQTAAGARLPANRVPFMTRFAGVLETAVRGHGATNLRWVTLQNEPNTTGLLISASELEMLYRILHDQLVTRGLESQIGLMVGDLVESGNDPGLPNANPPIPPHDDDHAVWVQYFVDHMSDITDAYSEHIYWNYWDIPRMEFRLRDARKLYFEDVPQAAQRPVYLTEFGVRGYGNLNPNRPGFLDEARTVQITRTNLAAFQQLWFDLAAAQLGFAGTIKWDAYWSMYDNVTQWAWMIGPASEGWPLFPHYHAMRLLFQTTARGWQVYRVDPWADNDWKPKTPTHPEYADTPEKELVLFNGTAGVLTLMGLDSHGSSLNTVSPETAQYAVGGLPASTTFNLAIWNATGDGTNVIGPTVTTTVGGVAYFQVPLHGAFALTTLPVS